MNRNTTALILIVLAIGIYFTFTSGKWDEVKAAQAINDTYITAIENSDRLIKLRDKVLGDYNSVSIDDRERLDKMVPNTVDNIRLIIDLNGVAMRRGFVLKNIKAAVSSEANKGSNPSSGGQLTASADTSGIQIENPILDTVTISFGLSAPLDQFMEFMKDLESNLRIMDLSHLSVTANDSGVYDFGVELKTYWLRQ